MGSTAWRGSKVGGAVGQGNAELGQGGVVGRESSRVGGAVGCEGQ